MSHQDPTLTILVITANDPGLSASVAEVVRNIKKGYFYNWLSFNNDTLRFYLEAVRSYEGLLKDDIQAIETDKDLAFLLTDRDKKDLEIQTELTRVQ